MHRRVGRFHCPKQQGRAAQREGRRFQVQVLARPPTPPRRTPEPIGARPRVTRRGSVSAAPFRCVRRDAAPPRRADVHSIWWTLESEAAAELDVFLAGSTTCSMGVEAGWRVAKRSRYDKRHGRLGSRLTLALRSSAGAAAAGLLRRQLPFRLGLHHGKERAVRPREAADLGIGDDDLRKTGGDRMGDAVMWIDGETLAVKVHSTRNVEILLAHAIFGL